MYLIGFLISDAAAALLALVNEWQNTPPNWDGTDPCGAGWDGIECTNSRITSMYFKVLISCKIATFSWIIFFEINLVASISDH